MKRRKHKKNHIKGFIFVIVVIIIGVFIIKQFDKEEVVEEPEKIVYLNNTDYNRLGIDENIDSLIKEYMDLYYESMSTLESKDMMNLFSTYEQGYINKTAIDLLIESRKMKNYDMKIDSAKYDIVYTSYELIDDIYTITFEENSYLNFNFMKEITSKVYGIENEVKVKEINGEYKIISYSKIQDFYVMITDNYEVSNDVDNVVKTKLDQILNDFLNDLQDEQLKLEDDYQDYINNKGNVTKTCDNNYDREKALEYALKYVTERNSEWTKYDDWGGNCQNYASQVLYAGGIPMDTVGHITLQWKHYSAATNESEVAEGRSYSWTGTGNFYDYALNNSGYGLCASVDTNYYYAEIGDIVQVGYDSNLGHAVVVIGNVKDSNDLVIDILINSNTVDLENYPLSGYVYPDKEIIKIIGWNN